MDVCDSVNFWERSVRCVRVRQYEIVIIFIANNPKKAKKKLGVPRDKSGRQKGFHGWKSLRNADLQHRSREKCTPAHMNAVRPIDSIEHYRLHTQLARLTSFPYSPRAQRTLASRDVLLSDYTKLPGRVYRVQVGVFCCCAQTFCLGGVKKNFLLKTDGFKPWTIWNSRGRFVTRVSDRCNSLSSCHRGPTYSWNTDCLTFKNTFIRSCYTSERRGAWTWMFIEIVWKCVFAPHAWKQFVVKLRINLNDTREQTRTTRFFMSHFTIPSTESLLVGIHYSYWYRDTWNNKPIKR